MRPTVHPETIDMIVAEYETDADSRADEAAWWRAAGARFEKVIERAGKAELWGKRHPHQRRIPARALAEGTAALLAVASRLSSAPDFLRLWWVVQAAFRPIRGLGELAVYDTAERLRYRLGLESEHVIFLHAGARVGARRLAGGRLPNESAWGIQRHEIPFGLRALSAHEIEDVLCIYKDELLLTPAQFRERRSGAARRPCSGAPEPRPGC